MMKNTENFKTKYLFSSLKNIFSIFFSFVLVLTLCQPLSIFAENTYEPVAGGRVSFEKYLIYNSQANCPNVNFKFTITSGEPIAPKEGKEAILSGSDDAISGDVRMYCKNNSQLANTAHFDSSKEKFSTVQAINTDLGQKSTLSKDPITLPTGKVYSRDEVTVDFTNVTFAEPGIYRWVISETSAALSPAQGSKGSNNESYGIINDENPTRYLDVYIDHNTFQGSNGSGTGTLKVVGYVLHSSKNFQPSSSSEILEPENDTKAIGYTNTFETHDITLNNTVGGNQGSTNKYFKFTISITNAGASNLITFSGAHDAKVIVDSHNSVTDKTYNNKENPTSVTTDQYGSAIVDVYLQHGQTYVIQGLPKNTSVGIWEIQDDYNAQYQIQQNGTIKDANSENRAEVNNITQDTIVSFTNTKNGTIPTGLIVTALPGLLLVSISFIVIFVIRKQKIEEF